MEFGHETMNINQIGLKTEVGAVFFGENSWNSDQEPIKKLAYTQNFEPISSQPMLKIYKELSPWLNVYTSPQRYITIVLVIVIEIIVGLSPTRTSSNNLLFEKNGKTVYWTELCWVIFGFTFHTQNFILYCTLRNKNNKLSINMYIKDYVIKQTQTRRLLYFLLLYLSWFLL